jgi:hypothetical protein
MRCTRRCDCRQGRGCMALECKNQKLLPVGLDLQMFFQL